MILAMKILLVSWFLVMFAGIGVAKFLEVFIQDRDRREFAVGLSMFVTVALAFATLSALVLIAVIHYN